LRVLAPELRRFLEPGRDPRISYRPALDSEFSSLAHDERQLLIGRFRVRRHQIAGFHRSSVVTLS